MENRKKPITQKDVARLAGVSPSIVSYVINNGPRSVSDETKQRVLDAIAASGYRPNKHAQMLMRSNWNSDQTVQFGVILGGGVKDLQRPFYGAILSGIYMEARATGRRVNSLQFFEDIKDPILFNQFISKDEIFGLIFLTVDEAIRTPQDEEMLEKIVERVGNVIVAERAWRNLPAVTINLQEAALKATTHLIRLGHRRIGYIGTRDDRIMGYRNALLEHELAYDLDLIWLDSVNSHTVGYEGATYFTELASPPTALFCANDEVATGAVGYLQASGFNVPQDIAVVGIDDVEQAAFLTPALTTVRIPKIELGRYAVRKLIEQIDRDEMPLISSVLPTDLIIRESCGAKLQLQ